MNLVQADFVGNARVYSDESSNREFERIFGFPPQLIRDAVRMALRSYMESDDIHTQLSGPGSNLYHTLVEQVRAALDENDAWTANRSVDNHTAPRAYRRDGLGLTFAQGTNSTGNIREELHLKKRVGSVTIVELQRAGGTQQVELAFDDVEKEILARPQTLWFLVYCRDGNTVHLEVSLPSGATDDGKITGWDKRIVLGDVSMTDVAVEERTDERGEDGEVGVSISAR